MLLTQEIFTKSSSSLCKGLLFPVSSILPNNNVHFSMLQTICFLCEATHHRHHHTNFNSYTTLRSRTTLCKHKIAPSKRETRRHNVMQFGDDSVVFSVFTLFTAIMQSEIYFSLHSISGASTPSFFDSLIVLIICVFLRSSVPMYACKHTYRWKNCYRFCA